MKSKIINNFQIKEIFFLFSVIIFSLNLKAQEVISLGDSGELGEVKIYYLLVSNKIKANQIDNLEGNVDLVEYPDAKLRILITASNLKPGYYLSICRTCYDSDVYGFFTTSRLPTKLKSGEAKINYRFKKENLNDNLAKALALTIYLKDRNGNKVGEENGYKSKGKSYKLILSDNYEGKGERKISNIQNILKSGDYEALRLICDKISPDKHFDGIRIPDNLFVQIKDKCEELNEENEIIDEEQQLWEDTKKRIFANKTLYSKKQILELYVKNNSSSKFIGEAKAKLDGIKNLISKSKKDREIEKEERQRMLAFVENFRIEEIEKIEGKDHFTISLAYTAIGNEKPDNISSTEFQVNPAYKGNVIEFQAPKGIKGSVTFDYNDIDFSIIESEKPVNIYELTTFVGGLSAKFEEQEEVININVIGGAPPFQLRFLSGSTIKSVEKIGLERAYSLNKNGNLKSGKQLLDGKYTLQIFDSSGNSVEKAKYDKEFIIGSSIGRYLEMAILPSILLLIGLLAYFLYHKSQTSQKLSNEEKINIKRKLGENRQLETANSIPTNVDTYQSVQNNTQSSRNPKRKKNIVISKRKPVGSGIQSPITLPKVATYPRLKKVEDMNFPPGFLLGKPDEYKRVELSDLWEKTFVSDIYIKEIFAYRINQFVFSENKEMLDSRGEKIPEIGGWIMGKYFKDNLRDKYVVSFERFIQIHTPLDKSTTQLTFGHNAWHDLEKAKDIYKDEELELVGWFHTHPGWGVFLSGEDINTHETYFTEPFHIAMELESVDEPHDVGFFSRRKGQGRLELNNRAKSYYRWSDFKQWLGKA